MGATYNPLLSAPRRPISPDQSKSIARRRVCAASGAVPSKIASNFTQGETVVLSVIAREVKLQGRCELCVDAIAAQAGVCRTVVQSTLRQARAIDLVTVTERRRAGRKSLTNVIEVISSEWRADLAWIGFRKTKTTNYKPPPFYKVGEPASYQSKIIEPREIRHPIK